MNILVIEDEAVASERLQQMINDHIPDAKIVGVCDSVEESVHFLLTQPRPDLLLMDIELSDGQSFSIFEDVEISSPVIFTTAYDEYVMKAFSVHSIDYLLKPIQVPDLQKAIAKFKTLEKTYGGRSAMNTQDLIHELRKAVVPELQHPRQHFLVKQGHRLISVHVDEIAFFYSEEKLTFLQTNTGKHFIVDQPLEVLETQVSNKRFFRCSRKYLVERSSISNVIIHFNGKLKVELRPAAKDDVIVSRDRSPEFKAWLGG